MSNNYSKNELLGERKDWEYRSFSSTTSDKPYNTYLDNHQKQTYLQALYFKKKFNKSSIEMSIWDAINLLDNINDNSDPDNIDIPQSLHSIQTAEKLRKLYPGEEYDWLHLTGLIHDLGKVLITDVFGSQPQWAVVGDTFPVGCLFSDKIVYSSLFEHNPDSTNSFMNNEELCGIYEPNCGFDNVVMSWGHDEYLYTVLKNNSIELPNEALYIIRYHSFYSWHSEGAYSHLASDYDKEMLKWLKLFSECDLYSKTDSNPGNNETKEYYLKLVDKYFPKKILKW
jgi:inositol oxygenase